MHLLVFNEMIVCKIFWIKLLKIQHAWCWKKYKKRKRQEKNMYCKPNTFFYQMKTFFNFPLPYLLTRCPHRIQIDLPVWKKFFGTGRKRYIDHHFFYVIFIERMYIKAKSKEWISGKTGMRMGIFLNYVMRLW